MSSAVEVSGLAKAYADVQAVRGLSFTAPAGAVTAVLGPNGAGKTTTLEICEGFRTRDAGTVSVLGLDPARDHAKLTQRVGVMLQSGGVYLGVQAREMLETVAAHAKSPLPTAPLMERLGLTTVAKRKWKQLSGGQQQRLSLAMAVVGRPELVFLDEPTAGLDVQARRATWDLVRDLRSAGVSVVLSTHAMDEAEELADHVVVVDRGAVVAEGSVGDLTRAESGELRFTTLPGLPLATLRDALPAAATVSEPSPGQYLVAADVTPTLVAAVTAWAASQEAVVSDLRTEQRSLEDVFLELTGRELRA